MCDKGFIFLTGGTGGVVDFKMFFCCIKAVVLNLFLVGGTLCMKQTFGCSPKIGIFEKVFRKQLHFTNTCSTIKHVKIHCYHFSFYCIIVGEKYRKMLAVHMKNSWHTG